MTNKLIFIAIVLYSFIVNYCNGQSAIYSSSAIHHPIISNNGMVASQHHLATEVGLEILRKGGNAIDAAVGVGFALAVVLPRAGNLGGGGFMLVHMNGDSETSAINYREMAPKAAHRDMYLKEQGDVDKNLFNQSYKSIGVPGTVAGLIHALDKYGTMSLKEVIKPSIRLAKKGFEVTHDLSDVLKKYTDRLQKSDDSERIFYKNKAYYEPGDILKQPDLAWSLKQICKKGKKGFYGGKLGKRIIDDIQANGGIMTLEDLQEYKVEETSAVTGSYKGYTISSMPPPSSGGVHIIQLLNMLEVLDIKSEDFGSAQYFHLLAECMRLAYADRSEHLGDPSFWDVPVDGLISKKYASDLVDKIKLDQANKSSDINPGIPSDYESEETTHFSVVDKYGNVVSNTYTLNFSFGTGLVAKGTGILLNNEMGDFSAKPGSPNAFGLLGGEANAIAPGKRPLSSMTPTIVLKNNKPYLVTGTPGGSRIITTVLQTILNVVEHGMNVAEAAHAPRIHHQWYPDILYHESYFNPDTKKILMRMGHSLKPRSAMGSTQSIMLKEGIIYGASDPRRPDAATKGY